MYATDHEGNTAAHYSAFDNQRKAYLLLKQHGTCNASSKREDSTRTRSTRRTKHLWTMYTIVFVPKNKSLSSLPYCLAWTYLRTTPRAGVSSPKSVMTALEHLKTLRGLPSLSILQRPHHSPRVFPSGILIRGTWRSWQRAWTLPQTRKTHLNQTSVGRLIAILSKEANLGDIAVQGLDSQTETTLKSLMVKGVLQHLADSGHNVHFRLNVHATDYSSASTLRLVNNRGSFLSHVFKWCP